MYLHMYVLVHTVYYQNYTNQASKNVRTGADIIKISQIRVQYTI